jgi:hypothetical protein
MLTDPIRETEGASSLHAPSNILNLRPILAADTQPFVHLTKILPGEDLEAGHDPFAGKLLDVLDRPIIRYLHLQRTLPKTQSQDFCDVLLHFSLEDDILAGDAKIDISFPYEGGNIGCGEKDTTRVVGVIG